MPKFRKPYPPEFRQQMADLALAGRTLEEGSREFEPTTQLIHKRVAEAGREGGRRKDGLSAAECEELVRLRREDCPRKLEREFRSEAAA